MYESFHIKNFRCFRDLKLDSLERVNLIAGQNNVGKTALLEAIFLLLNLDDPPQAVKTSWRTLNPADPNSEMIVGSLFHNYDLSIPIELSGENTEGGMSSLRISADKSQISQIEISHRQKREMRLEYQGENGQAGSWSIRIAPGEDISGGGNRMTAFSPIVFIQMGSHSPHEDVNRFSNLKVVGRQSEILSILQLLEPRLQQLEILGPGFPLVVYGDVGIGRLLPISVMGEGMNRLLAIALAIVEAQHGVVLIDEVENGVHYSVMSKVWTAIAQAARAADVQIFATTHSWECICAAHQAFSDSGQYDFRLHRLDRIDDDIRAVSYSQEMLGTAIKTGLEVR